MNEQKTVIVLGMHRSGTSVIAGILKALGIEMGKDAWGCNYSNSFGHFEDEEFNRVNIEIVKAAGGDWAHPPSRAEILKAGCNFNHEMEEIINKRETVALWGWKDPQTILTLECWMPYIKNPVFIVVFRNNYDVALSLQERDSLDIESGLRLVVFYQATLNRQLRLHPLIPRFFLTFESILASPLLQAKKLARFLGADFQQKQRNEIKKFVVTSDVIEDERRRYSMEAPREVIRLQKELETMKYELDALRKQALPQTYCL